MNRSQLIDSLKRGHTVVVNLQNASVVFCKSELRPINHYRASRLTKIIVNDPVYGSIFFSGFSAKLDAISRGDKISLKVTVTGVGDPSDKYPEPILFAKPATRRADSIAINTPVATDSDLTVNV